MGIILKLLSLTYFYLLQDYDSLANQPTDAEEKSLQLSFVFRGSEYDWKLGHNRLDDIFGKLAAEIDDLPSDEQEEDQVYKPWVTRSQLH